MIYAKIENPEQEKRLIDELKTSKDKNWYRRLEAGCYIRTKNEEFNIPAYKVEVIDTTGAGDSFVGGFLTGMVKGWSLRESGKFANAVGALCVTALGLRPV